jgi:hypothetical protein
VKTDHGLTPREFASLFRVHPQRVRNWIRSGRLGAVNLGERGRDRFVILPEHERAFVAARSAVIPTPRRRRRPVPIDYYP